jgi:hypothetical protein
MKPQYSKALIIGAGAGLSASLARLFAAKGMKLVLAARSTSDLAALAAETGASLHACDAADHGQVTGLFAALDREGAPDVVVYNPSARVRGPFVELDPAASLPWTRSERFRARCCGRRRVVRPADHPHDVENLGAFWRVGDNMHIYSLVAVLVTLYRSGARPGGRIARGKRCRCRVFDDITRALMPGDCLDERRPPCPALVATRGRPPCERPPGHREQ